MALATATDAMAEVAPEPTCPRAAAFLRLAPAGPEQQRWFEEAFAKLGLEADRWAYTEQVWPMEGGRPLVVRIDPSRPEGEQYSLLAIDGRPARPEEIQRWREEEHETPDLWAELTDIRDMIDRSDLRIFHDEPAALVFEAPLCRGGSAEFPPDQFQALLRVNKASRSFEDIVIKAREPIRVAGVAKITDVGIEIRFRTLDPAFAPQPVSSRSGGVVRVLLAKITRERRIERTDFQLIERTNNPTNDEP